MVQRYLVHKVLFPLLEEGNKVETYNLFLDTIKIKSVLFRTYKK